MKYANKSITALVTGTNQGIGKFLALQLLKNNPDSKFLFTTFQNPEKTLKQSPQFMEYSKKGKMTLKNLDLSNDSNIEKFVQQVKDQKWKFDALVNNAAMGFDEGNKIPNIEWAKKLMKTNIYGTIKFTNSLLPFLKENGRIVNVSSRFGALRNHPQFVVRRFTDPNLEEKQIFESADEFISLCQKNEMGTRFKSAYGTSKMMLNAWSRIILKRKLQHGQVSLSMSPGRCSTEMRKTGGVHSAQSGARAIYDCIFMENPSFDVFYHRWQKADFVKCGPQIDAQDEFTHWRG